MARSIESEELDFYQIITDAFQSAKQDALLALGSQEFSRMETAAYMSNIPRELIWAETSIKVGLESEGLSSEEVFLETWQRIFQEPAPDTRFARFGIVYARAISSIKLWQELDNEFQEIKNAIDAGGFSPDDPSVEHIFEPYSSLLVEIVETRKATQLQVAIYVMNERGVDIRLRRESSIIGKIQDKVKPDNSHELMTKAIKKVENHFLDPHQVARIRLLANQDHI